MFFKNVVRLEEVPEYVWILSLYTIMPNVICVEIIIITHNEQRLSSERCEKIRILAYNSLKNVRWNYNYHTQGKSSGKCAKIIIIPYNWNRHMFENYNYHTQWARKKFWKICENYNYTLYMKKTCVCKLELSHIMSK